MDQTQTNSKCSAHHPDQKTALVGQIARACAVFCVDEIVVFDDGQVHIGEPEPSGYTAFTDPNFFLYHVLSYLETPPHLRKALFPIHPDLKNAGALPSLDMPHHLRSQDFCTYREGLTIEPASRDGSASGTMVDCGLSVPIYVPVDLEMNTRLTVKINSTKDTRRYLATEGDAVSPETPREEDGYYWGYSVRQASSLSNVFTECSYDGGYDVSVGTSERGIPIAPLLDGSGGSRIKPDWKHLLIVFGGIAGLEAALAADEELLAAGVKTAREVFDYWVNLVPGQGSRTIRTEEALWVGLTALRPLVMERNAT